MVLCSLTWIIAFAHPGRTDSNGGHWVRTEGWGYEVGTYHYHDGSSAGQSSSSSSEREKRIQNKVNALKEKLVSQSNSHKDSSKPDVSIKDLYYICLFLFSPFILSVFYWGCVLVKDFIVNYFPISVLKRYNSELSSILEKQELMKSLISLPEDYENSLVPDDCIIDEKGLPKDKVDDTLKYFHEGKYTLYTSAYGKKVHRRCSCHGAHFGVSAYNYYDEKDFKNMLCGRCAKNYELPSFEWYDTYLEAINSNKKYEEHKNDIKKHISEINFLEKKLNKKYVYCFLTKKQKQRLSTYRNVFEDSLKS